MIISALPYPIYSVADTAKLIYEGEDPWYALGNFLHDWWCNAVDHRQDLIAEPPATASTLEEKRWAAFCAAIVEELCSRTSFPCPTWTNQQYYLLEQPWFFDSQPSQRDWLLSTTLESFKRHNVFVDGNILDNKYELEGIYGSKPRWTIWSDEELQELFGSKGDE